MYIISINIVIILVGFSDINLFFCHAYVVNNIFLAGGELKEPCLGQEGRKTLV